MTEPGDMPASKSGWKRKLIHEVVEYWINFAYLAFFLVAFIWYRRLILAEYHVPYTNYWYPLIEAAVLAKVIMVGDTLHLGRGLRRQPLIVLTLYRTAAFSVFVALFKLLEAMVRGLIQGRGLAGGLHEIAGKDRNEVIASSIVIVVAFVPFFALKELGRVLGESRLRSWFWTRAAHERGPSDCGTPPV